MLVSLLTAVLLTASPGPLEVVKEGNTNVQKVASAKAATAEQVYQVVERFVDFGELSKRALGETWNKLTAAQRKDFSSAMEGLLRASYAQKALGQGRTQVHYGKESIEGNEASVGTTVNVNRDKYPVNYKLYRSGEQAGWRIYDVVTDDVSLLETYQEQFRKILATKGFDGLLATLKAKRAQIEKTLIP
jgi:phospholipid transport system substrate-binding protein